MTITDELITRFSVVGLEIFLGAFAAATAAIKVFADESKQIFETGVVFKNLGLSQSTEEIQRFADSLSQVTGLGRGAIEGSAGLLARAGVGGNELERTLKIIGDTARGTGKSFDEVGGAIEKGILGHMRGLVQFGIALQDTGSKAANLALIQQQLNLRFEGAAEAFRDTLPGAMDAFQNSLQRFLSGLGEQFAPVAIRILNSITTVVDFLTAHIQTVADLLVNSIFGPLGVLGFHLLQQDTGNPLSKVGHGGDLATEATALQIADNTKMMADAVTQQVLGGSGEIVNQSFGFLQARLAMAI